MPLLLFLVFAIGDFGIAYTQWNSLTNAVREGARAGVPFRTPCNAAAVETQVENTITNYASSAGITNVISTTVNNPCGGTGTPLTVTATVPYNYIAVSALSNLFGPGLAPTINLSARTIMRNE
jgi:Flp pilus assembly protein TadG